MNLVPPDDTPPRADDADRERPTYVFHVVGGRTVFIDRQRGQWRVYDYSEPGGATRLEPVGSPAAEYRLFVAQNGTRRRHSFPRAESRELDPARVAAQFAASVAVPGTPDAS